MIVIINGAGTSNPQRIIIDDMGRTSGSYRCANCNKDGGYQESMEHLPQGWKLKNMGFIQFYFCSQGCLDTYNEKMK